MSSVDGTACFMRADRDGVFLAWGPGLEGVFGYTEAEVLGRNLEFLIPPKLRRLHRRGFSRALTTGRLKHQGKVVRSVGMHKDGRLVPYRAVDILEFGEDGAVETVGAVIMQHGWARSPSAYGSANRRTSSLRTSRRCP